MTFTEIDALKHAIRIAKLSPCEKSKRGAVIFHRQTGVLSVGCNSQPDPFECQGKNICGDDCRILAVHAEQNAILALNRHHHYRVYTEMEILHVAVSSDGNLVEKLIPQCWQCSKIILSAGITKVWLTGGTIEQPIFKGWAADEFHYENLKNNNILAIKSLEIVR